MVLGKFFWKVILRLIQEFLENSCGKLFWMLQSYSGILGEFFWQVILKNILTICLIFDCTSNVSVHVKPPEAQLTFAGKRFMTS